jgi:hypothetical protein
LTGSLLMSADFQAQPATFRSAVRTPQCNMMRGQA